MESRITHYKLILLPILLFVLNSGNAQTFKEWFKQKKTQKEYLVKQITGLQLYMGYLKEGYQTLRWGWSTVESIRNGEFKLHGDFFNGLASISPAVRKYNTIPRFIDRQIGLIKQVKAAKKLFAAQVRIKPNEKVYLDKVLENVVERASGLLDELIMVAMQTELEMTEGERLKRIDLLYGKLLELDGFLRAFNRENYQLLSQRAWKAREIDVLKTLYEIP